MSRMAAGRDMTMLLFIDIVIQKLSELNYYSIDSSGQARDEL